MKKYFKLFSLLLVVVMMTGCVKYNVNMKIDNNKNMKFEAIVAYSEQLGNSYKTTDEEKKEFEKKGFKVEDYKEGDYSGIKLIKTYKNIDKYSSKDPVTLDLNAMLDPESKEQQYFFQKTSSNLFKSRYKVVIKADTSEATGGMNTNSDPVDNGGTEETTTDNDSGSTDTSGVDPSSYLSSMDLKYTVEVPKVVNKGNSTSQDGNKLTWDLTKVKEDITYEFEVTNMNAIYGIVAVAVIAVICVVVVISKNGKKEVAPVQSEPAKTE